MAEKSKTEVLKCYHCGAKTAMRLVGSDISRWDEGKGYTGVEEWSFYMCPMCEKPTFLADGRQEKNGQIVSGTGRKIAYPDRIFDDECIPVNIRKAFLAASATKSMDTSLSKVAWRRMIDLICMDQGAKGSVLYDKISDLCVRGILPTTLMNAEHLIRSLGEDEAYNVREKVSKADITRVETLVRYILQYLYILPKEMSELY